MPDAVAFLGVGLMGGPMASRLLAVGYETALWNRTRQKAERYASMGARVCDSPGEAVDGAAFVCLCLTDQPAVEAVLFGPERAAAAMKVDTILIDFSTIGVRGAAELALRLAKESGASWLDCPVSGGVAGAEAGTLAIFAGGRPDVISRAMPLLSCLSARVTHMGDVGAGQAAKLCNQLIVAANLIAIAEAIALGRALGVDVSVLPSAMQGGFADSKPLQIYGPHMAAHGEGKHAASQISLMHKDVVSILDAAHDASIVLPLAERLEGFYHHLIKSGLGAEDLAALIRLYDAGPNRKAARADG